jgi:ABC-2 type transport system ATP-binding protein
VEIQLEKEPPAQIIEDLKRFKEVVDIVNIQPSSLRLYLNNVEEFVPRMMNMLVKKSVPITSIHMTEPSLDDVFVHYTGLTIEEAQKGGE